MTALANIPEHAGVALGGKDVSWMSTHSGGRFYPFSPMPQDVNIIDIAHALSNQCRYNGHTKEFYSVAQHSVQGAWACDKLWGREVAKQFLLHDATEAYIGDMIRPIKIYYPEFYDIEDKVWTAIAAHFKISEEFDPRVKLMDNLMCVWEKRDLLNTEDIWHNMPSLGEVNYYFLPLSGWDPYVAKRLFLEVYNEYFNS